MTNTTEALTGLSVDELEALAESLLAPASQARLDDLLTRRADKALKPEPSAEDKGFFGRLWDILKGGF